MSTARPDVVPVPPDITIPPTPISPGDIPGSLPDEPDRDFIIFGRWLKLVSLGFFSAATVLSFISPLRGMVGGGLLANVATAGLVGAGLGALIQRMGYHDSILIFGTLFVVVVPIVYKTWINRRKAKKIADDLGWKTKDVLKTNGPAS